MVAQEFINLKSEVYDQLALEFLSSLHVDWSRHYKGNEVLIKFHMFNGDVE